MNVPFYIANRSSFGNLSLTDELIDHLAEEFLHMTPEEKKELTFEHWLEQRLLQICWSSMKKKRK